MAADGDDGNGTETCGGLHLCRQHTYTFAGLYETPEALAREAQRLQEVGIEVARRGVEHLGGGGHGVFADGLAREHIDERVGDEEDLVGMGEGGAVFTLQGKEMEQRVEGHKLDAGTGIDVLLGHPLGEETLHTAVGVRVAVAVGEAQQLTVFVEEGEVAAPRVDADAL